MNKSGKVPRLVAKVARAQNKNAQGLQGGRGVKILKSRGRTLITGTASEAAEALTQAEFNAMFLVALTDGAIYDEIFDIAVDVLFTYIAQEDIDVCGLGTVSFAVW